MWPVLPRHGEGCRRETGVLILMVTAVDVAGIERLSQRGVSRKETPDAPPRQCGADNGLGADGAEATARIGQSMATGEEM